MDKEKVLNSFQDFIINIVNNELKKGEKWITIKPHGEDNPDYRHIKLEAGESPKEAIDRIYKKDDVNKSKQDKYYEQYAKEYDKANEQMQEYGKKGHEYFIKREDLKDKIYQIRQEQYSLMDKGEEEKANKLMNKANEMQLEYIELDKKYMDAYTKKEEFLKKYGKKNDYIAQKLLPIYENSIESTLKNFDAVDILQNISDDEITNNEYQKSLKDIDEYISKHNSMTDEYNKYIRDFNKKAMDKAINYSDLSKSLSEYKENYKKAVIDIDKKLKSAYKIKHEALLKVFDKNVNALKIDNGATFNIHGTKSIQDATVNLQKIMNGMIAKELISNNNIDVTYKRGRAYFRNDTNKLYIDTTSNNAVDTTPIHEAMHWLEYNNPEIRAKSIAFLKYRTKDEKEQSLRKLTGIKGYASGEMSKKDNFFNPYCGKIYKNYLATEVLSMGIERIIKEPKKFYNEDKEYFNFVVGILHNKI